MNTIKLYIRFIINKNHHNLNGNVLIKCRLTYNKNRKDFSTGISVNPDYWDPKKQILLDQSDQEETINMQISLIKIKLYKDFLMLQVKEEPYTDCMVDPHLQFILNVQELVKKKFIVQT